MAVSQAEQFRESVRRTVEGLSDQIEALKVQAAANSEERSAADGEGTAAKTRHAEDGPNKLKANLALMSEKAELLVDALRLDDARTEALERENDELRYVLAHLLEARRAEEMATSILYGDRRGDDANAYAIGGEEGGRRSGGSMTAAMALVPSRSRYVPWRERAIALATRTALPPPAATGAGASSSPSASGSGRAWLGTTSAATAAAHASATSATTATAASRAWIKSPPGETPRDPSDGYVSRKYPTVKKTAGTMFVTELSELLDLDDGEHAALADIMDGQWEGEEEMTTETNEK